jgi:hypothetical protein
MMYDHDGPPKVFRPCGGFLLASAARARAYLPTVSPLPERGDKETDNSQDSDLSPPCKPRKILKDRLIFVTVTKT